MNSIKDQSRILAAFTWTGVLIILPSCAVAETMDSQQSYLSGMREAIRASTMTDVVGENHLFENLKYQHGEAAQAFRVLWWAAEVSPHLRKELVRQWIAESSPRLSPEEIARKYRGMIEHFRSDIRAERMKEIDEVLQAFQDSPEKMSEVPHPERRGEKTGMPILDALDEAALFHPGSPEWLEMVRNMPLPFFPSEGGDDVGGAVYQHLWATSPRLDDKEVEAKLLEGAIRRFGNFEQGIVLREVYEKPLFNLPAAEQAKRKAMVNALLDTKPKPPPPPPPSGPYYDIYKRLFPDRWRRSRRSLGGGRLNHPAPVGE